jgi:hypothetical protein
MSQAGTTTIAISVETKEMLRILGEKSETYDTIIRRIIREAGLKRLDARWNKILENDEFVPLEDL